MDMSYWLDNYTNQLFSSGHIAQIAIMLFVLIFAGFIFWKRKSIATIVFITLAVLTNGLLIGSLIFSIVNDCYNIEWYLPLHICNLFGIVFLLQSIFKRRVRKFLNEYTLYCGIIGCLYAVIVPATTGYHFAPFESISVMVWLYHICIGVGGVYVLVSGIHVVKFTNLWKVFVILIPMAIVAIVFNFAFDSCFMGLNANKIIVGIDLIAKLSGKFFIPSMFLMLIIPATALSVISLILDKHKFKLVGHIISNSKIFSWIKRKVGATGNDTLLDALLKNRRFSALYSYYHDKFVNSDFYEKVMKSGVIDKLKNMTVEELATPAYMCGLIKESQIIQYLVSLLSFNTIKKFIVKFKQIMKEEDVVTNIA